MLARIARAGGALSLLLMVLGPGAHATALTCRTPMGPFASLVAVAGPSTLDPSDPGISTCLAIASHASTQSSDVDSYLFDGESTQLQLAGLWALGEHWRVGAQVPWISWGGGVLDGVIDTWHSAFGLPDGIRDDVPRGQLNLEYARQGNTVGRLVDGTSGIGDVGLMLARRLGAREDGQGETWLSLRGELPTGDPARLTGSDGVDLSLTAHWHRDGAFAVDRLRLQAQAGIARLGDGQVLGAALTTWTGFGGGAVDFRVGPRVSLGAGLDLRSAVVEADVPDLDGLAGVLHIGVALTLAPRHTVRFGFSEDILVSSHPDVVFRLQWTRRGTTAR